MLLEIKNEIGVKNWNVLFYLFFFFVDVKMVLEGRRGGGKSFLRGNFRGVLFGFYVDRYVNIFCFCIYFYFNYIGNMIKKKNSLSV